MRIVLPSLLAALALGTPALADEIRLRDGHVISDVDVTDETYEKVSYKIHGSPQEEPSSNVGEVVYARTPLGYAEAKKAFERGDYARCLGDWDGLRRAKEPWARQYAAFYFAECKRMGGDGAGATGAYEQLLKDFPKTRFYPQARLGIGLVKLDAKDYAGAQKAFEDVVQEAKAKNLGDEVAGEATFKLAATLELQGKLREAADRYSRLASEADAKGGGHAGRMAKIAASRLQAQQDASKADSALSTLQDFVASQGPDRLKPNQQPDFEALAAAWNAIGEADAAKGEYAKATLDFLRAALDPDLAKIASERPHALYGAALAFEKAKTQDWKERADQLRAELKQTYPQSPWARK
jgi:hypothetical protein